MLGQLLPVLLLSVFLFFTCAPISTSSFSVACSPPLPAFAPTSPRHSFRTQVPPYPHARATCSAPPAARITRTSFFSSPFLRGSLPGAGLGLRTSNSPRIGAGGLTCLYSSFDSNEIPDDFPQWNEYVTDEDWEGDRMVLLRDPNADRVIECFIDRELEVEGKKYATLMPADTPVIIASYETVNGTEQLMPVLDDEDIDKLFDTASAVLAEVDLLLSRSAVVLTVEGGMISEDEEYSDSDYSGDEDSDDEDDDDDDDDMDNFSSDGLMLLPQSHGGPVALRMDELVDSASGKPAGSLAQLRSPDDDEDDDDNEKVQVLATFFFEGKKHIVAAPLEPVLIIGSPAPVKEDVETWEEGVLKNIMSDEKSKSVDEDSNEDEDEDESSEKGDVYAGLENEENTSDSEDDDEFYVEYLVPDREELERVTPIIEKELENMHENEVQEKRKLLNFRDALLKQWNTDK